MSRRTCVTLFNCDLAQQLSLPLQINGLERFVKLKTSLHLTLLKAGKLDPAFLGVCLFHQGHTAMTEPRCNVLTEVKTMVGSVGMSEGKLLLGV